MKGKNQKMLVPLYCITGIMEFFLFSALGHPKNIFG